MQIALLLALSLLCPLAIGQSADRIPPSVSQALVAAHIPTSAVGIVVQEAGSGSAQLGINADQPMNPASVMKLITTYGSRQEIARALQRVAEAVAAGQISPNEITTELIAEHLDTAGLPDPDLIIRTSGEQRLSNFLLWQAAYSELVFVPVYWPDFDRAALEGAIAEFRGRERRFGGLLARTAS